MNQRNKKEYDLVKKACQELGEHFDSVQIFVSRHEQGIEEGTLDASWGVGNFFSRFGQIKFWLLKQEEAHGEDADLEN
jgi:hypothetical protein